MAEEFEALDRKALEQQYVASYHYTIFQRIMAAIVVIVVICGIIACGTFLFMSLISLL